MASKSHVSPPSSSTAPVAPVVVRGGPFAFLHNAIGFCLEWFIELLVRATGRSVRKTEAPWLGCFLGKPGLIGTGIYDRIAAESGLRIRAPKDAGLIADFNALRHTFCTNLQRAGNGQRVVMELMRHSDRRLTDKVYTDTQRLDAYAAISSLKDHGTHGQGRNRLGKYE